MGVVHKWRNATLDNFINILRPRFSYEILARTAFVWHFGAKTALSYEKRWWNWHLDNFPTSIAMNCYDLDYKGFITDVTKSPSLKNVIYGRPLRPLLMIVLIKSKFLPPSWASILSASWMTENLSSWFRPYLISRYLTLKTFKIESNLWSLPCEIC